MMRGTSGGGGGVTVDTASQGFSFPTLWCLGDFQVEASRMKVPWGVSAQERPGLGPGTPHPEMGCLDPCRPHLSCP